MATFISTLKKRYKSRDAQEARLAWALISPTALIVLGIVIFPAFFSIWVSFHDIGLHNLNDVFNAPYVGWGNYQKVFEDFAFKFQGMQSWGAAVTSVVYSFSATIFTLMVGLVAALLLNRPFRGRGLTRAIFLFPYVAPVVSIAFVWRWLLDPRPSGVLNDILMRLNLIELPMAYLATRGLALFIVILFEGGALKAATPLIPQARANVVASRQGRVRQRTDCFKRPVDVGVA